MCEVLLIDYRHTIRLSYRVRKITQAMFVCIRFWHLIFSVFIITDKIHCHDVQVKSQLTFIYCWCHFSWNNTFLEHKQYHKIRSAVSRSPGCNDTLRLRTLCTYLSIHPGTESVYHVNNRDVQLKNVILSCFVIGNMNAVWTSVSTSDTWFMNKCCP